MVNPSIGACNSNTYSALVTTEETSAVLGQPHLEEDQRIGCTNLYQLVPRANIHQLSDDSLLDGSNDSYL